MAHSTSRSTAPFAAAIRPADGRGTTALVVGASARARRALVSECLSALADSSPACLAVRLPPRAPGGHFLSNLDAALDEALHALGAPDAPHEATDDAARVGRWLYRARAVGREGIVLALDELDAWLDGRSGTSDAPDVLRLLSACRRAPVSVLASVRASSPTATPALAQDVASLFERTEALGGAPATVTRDPTALTAALAGRSFHRAGVLAAVDAWLDLPPPLPGCEADDVAVVFSSPLAPPVLPQEPIAWPSPPEAPARTEAKPATAPRAVVTTGDLPRWSAGLRAALALTERVRRARAAAVHDVASAERVFRELVAPMPAALDEVTRAAAGAGVRLEGMRAAVAEATARFETAFAAVLDAVLRGETSATTLESLGDALGEHASTHAARATAFVVLPGLRLDLWGRFCERVVTQVPGLRPARVDGLAWSLPGTRGSVDEPLRGRRERRGALEVTALAAYAAEDDAARVETVLPAALCAMAGSFVGRTAVLLAGEGVGDARGSASVIVPWGLYTYEPHGVRNA